MFQSYLNATLRLLAFRAGPQDFPYAPALTPWVLALGALPVLTVYSLALPLGMAVTMALATIAGLTLVTRTLLRMRGLEPRYAQTLHALILANALLTLLMLPAFAAVAPKIVELARNPELLQDPQAAQLPAGPVFLMNLLNIWTFAVTAYIFRHAANLHIAWGVLLALLTAFAVILLVAVFGSFAGALLGTGAV